MQTREIWDVAVIGGGPAGMMAAGRAAESGARTILLEKNPSLGRKLLITGGGRCNVANAEFDTRILLSRFKAAGKFLASPFSRFAARESLEFFNSRGVATVVEAEGRAFPATHSSQTILDALAGYLAEHGVTIATRSETASVDAQGPHIGSVTLKDGRSISAKQFILATGGISHPETGSTGDGYSWLRALGHTVNETDAALVPIALKDPRIARAAGVAIPEAKIALCLDGAKQSTHKGKMLFTHFGLSGPAILNMSREIGDALPCGTVALEIDLFPESGYDTLNELLLAAFAAHSNKLIRNALASLIPPALAPLMLEIAGVDPGIPCNGVTRPARVAIMKALKHARFEVKALLGSGKAIITSGGVALNEIDFKTMRSLKYENLYLAGDLLDIDRPSGGYSLQLCWTTGFVAGSAAAIASKASD